MRDDDDHDGGLPMDRQFIEGMIALFERSNLIELDHESERGRLRLVRSNIDGAALPLAAPANPSSQSEAKASSAALAETVSVITAPCVGTFYRSSGSGKQPFVSIGDLVNEGQTVAIVEAMKMLNAIEADCSGRIVKIYQEDGAMVAAGDRLFEIERGDDAHV